MQTKGVVTLGPPHLLLIPVGPWQKVIIDLIIGLLRVWDVDGVYTVVDWFMKEIVVFPVSHIIMSEELSCKY